MLWVIMLFAWAMCAVGVFVCILSIPAMLLEWKWDKETGGIAIMAAVGALILVGCNAAWESLKYQEKEQTVYYKLVPLEDNRQIKGQRSNGLSYLLISNDISGTDLLSDDISGIERSIHYCYELKDGEYVQAEIKTERAVISEQDNITPRVVVTIVSEKSKIPVWLQYILTFSSYEEKHKEYEFFIPKGSARQKIRDLRL